MQSYENLPMSPTKRLGVSLNVDTGYNKNNSGKGIDGDDSPPHMQSNGKSESNKAGKNGRALTVDTDPRETFLDDITPVNSSVNRVIESERGNRDRDSHDLSLSPRQITRDSLVDNMLLSLDQFSFGHDLETQPTLEEDRLYSSFGDSEHYQPTQNFAPRNGTGRGGTGHNYSYSSDYEIGDDSSRYSGQTRGRRSHSSSNIPTTYAQGRGNTHIRNESIPNSTFNKGPPIQIPPQGIHSRSGKGSKSSSAGSFDLGYAQVTSNQRWGHTLPGRSSSFDYGNRANTMDRQTSGTFSPLDYEAAPTPTVPGGPRRPRPISPIAMVKSTRPESPHKLERKRSTRSSKSAYKNKASLKGGRLDYGLNDPSRDLPPLPAFLNEQPAPSPLVGYGKTKDLPAAQPVKERPGFFRRVFGSSRNVSTTSTADPPRSHGSTTSTDTNDRPNSKTNHIASQMKSQHAVQPSRDLQTAPKEHVPLLTKKPSSFFRRRKKSVTEPEPPMPPPVVPHLRYQPEIASNPGQSPVSSLRKVMNPYLRSPGKSLLDPQHPQHQLREQMNPSPENERYESRNFSPEYEPDKSATIRTVEPLPKNAPEEAVASHSLVQSAPMASKPQPRYLGLDGNNDDEDGTFLQDNSDNDPDTSATKSTNDTKSREATPAVAPVSNGNPTQSPSVARDMALVAEYERMYLKRSPNNAKLEKSDAAKSSPVVESPIPVSKAIQKPSIVKDDEWVMVTPRKAAHPPSNDKENRVWLEASESDDESPAVKLAPPKKATRDLERASGSTEASYKSATSLPILQVEGEEPVEKENAKPKLKLSVASLKTGTGDVAEPVEGDRERAKKIYDGNEDFIHKDKAAAWLGEESDVRTRTLVAYMELYDFSNINILAALRVMCGRLVLKAESQQVDRILDGFARRWCQCNPKHGFKVTDVVHTICYSVLLLNTDLHLADIDQKMTRSQFVKNTIPTIRRNVADAAPGAFEPNRPSILPDKSQTFELEDTSAKQSTGNLKAESSSIDVERPSWRSSFMAPAKGESDGKLPTPLDYDSPLDDCGPLVKAPFYGTERTWEVQVEIVLKDFYNSIRNERLPLFGAPVEKTPLTAQSSSTLSVFANGMLRRTPSVLSKAPSAAESYARGRTADTVRSGTGKFSNKNRSRPRLYPNSGMGSSRTSLDDQASMWSPSVSSSTWSKYSLGKTQASMSVDSFGSNWQNGDYQQSIGFANAISQAIIREETTLGSTTSGTSEDLRVAPLLEDESLELEGAPWAKEGIVKHKHHLEGVNKRAKDRAWSEVFAVIEKGYMSVFSFSSKSMRNKSKGKASGGVVGGGNWQDNAENLGSFLLRQTIASALPSPGYSKARPHVWALSLPNGAVHLFQVGTPDIVKEFVSSANYWSARLSNHPLVGGISNIEYGWSDAIVNNALVAAINESTERRPSTSATRPSLQSSLRSSLDQGSSGVGYMKSRLPGDKITISDWTPPTQSMRSSNLMEADQLRTLSEYVAGIEEDLQKHNQLRSSMLLAFTPRHPNAVKAMGNWEAKSSYLLHEIVKFRTYIDILQAAETSKQRVYSERAVPEIPEDAADA